ncbi:glycosyltransferase family 2 protein [Terricaulis sp.]|uniref:glycosyltransferase family 2 protein n=1 Tax=Terricaulis sp. TaxID=2768686 RepID=UPI0037833056
MSDPVATIIVVTHNSARWLERMSAAVAAQTETRWRLVVVDNASRADERPQLTALPAGSSVVQNETNLGFAAANNVGAQDAQTPYLVLLNPDAFPEPGWLAALITAVERYPGAAAIGSTQIRAGHETLFDGTGDVMHASGLAYRSNYGRPRSAPPPEGETFSACAAAMLVRRAAFENVGGFDARYFCYLEDVDLCFRLRLDGWRIVQCADAVVAHVGGGVLGARSAFGDFHGARNRLWTFVKCMPAPLFWPLFPVHVAASVLAVTATLLQGRGFAAWHGLIAGFAGLGAMWNARGAVQRARKARSGDIAAALAWNPLRFIGRRPVIRPVR